MYSVTGIRLDAKNKGKKVTVGVDASSKQEIWNNPRTFGFQKIFRVT